MSQVRTATGSGPRLLMLGLDSASLPFIHDNRPRLPVLASLLDAGTVRTLRSPATYLSASVWPTFSSGLQPGGHGQYFPFQWCAADGRYRRVADAAWSEDFDCEPFWHRLARSGVPAVAFDVAHALHDERAPGLQITNWSYQSSGKASASDAAVLRDIRRRFGRRPIGPEVPVPKTARQCSQIRDQLVSAVRAKADATLYLMDWPWRLFVTGWYEVHRAGHNLWPVEGDFGSDASPEAMLAVYEETDRQLARVVERLERDRENSSLVLFSLHGMEPNRAQDHFLTEILTRLNRIYLGGEPTRKAAPAVPNAMAFLRRALPPTLQYRTAALLGEAAQDWVVNRALVAGRDWAASPAFPVLSGGEGLIRLNLRGREPSGFFQHGSAELANFVEWLKSRLLEIRVAATGEPLVANVVMVDEELPGSRRDFLPDLIVQWAPEAPVDRICSAAIGEIHVSLATGRGGNHNDQAFFVARGSNALRKVFRGVEDISELGRAAERFLTRPNVRLRVPVTPTATTGMGAYSP